MYSPIKNAIIAAVGIVCLGAISLPAAAQTQQTPKAPAQKQSQLPKPKMHYMVIQVIQSEPGVMNAALNNAENLTKYYEDKGEKVEIEFVAHGNGLAMLRTDTSPVKDRITAMSSKMKNVSFTGCANTIANQSKAENKDVTLIPEAKIVPAGIARILELQEKGWAYVRS
jgi:intracellular sulfur oxidation DsrE/DsrF family protein